MFQLWRWFRTTWLCYYLWLESKCSPYKVALMASTSSWLGAMGLIPSLWGSSPLSCHHYQWTWISIGLLYCMLTLAQALHDNQSCSLGSSLGESVCAQTWMLSWGFICHFYWFVHQSADTWLQEAIQNPLNTHQPLTPLHSQPQQKFDQFLRAREMVEAQLSRGSWCNENTQK